MVRGFIRKFAALLVLPLIVSGCWSRSEPGVVVYAALDAEFSRPILEDFTRETGVAVRTKFDLESTKTVGLTNLIMAEAQHPRADVFWNNEILNTLRLEKKGLLDTYRSPAAESYPELFRSPDGAWHGFAARARVLLVNTDLVERDSFPNSIHDLADPQWRGKTGMAKPLFGTTATHAACLFAAWGDRPAKDYFQALKENEIQILAGNKQVALAVASGQLALGITDTDDAIIELEHGHPVAIVYPDREDDQMGTLFIPNTLAIVKGGPHPQDARRLVDYLLQPAVEAKLAKGASAQIPLNTVVESEVRIETPRTVKAMAVDFEAAAEKWETAARFLRDEFTGAR